MLEDNGNTFVLRDPNGFHWDQLPVDVRNSIHASLEELRAHRNSLLEPSISNLGAVSQAIAKLRSDDGSSAAWIVALETILVILANIVNNPQVARYYRVSTSNEVFHKKIGHLSNGTGIIPFFENMIAFLSFNCVDLLVSLGFREEESGALVLPLSADIPTLEARRLELELGLKLLRESKSKTCVAEESGVGTMVRAKAALPAGAGKKEKLIGEKLGKPGEGVVAEAPSKKTDVTASRILKEEREKRAKAEAVVLSQRDLMSEMTRQISELQDVRSQAISLRQGLAISRLESSDKSKVKAEMEKMGVKNHFQEVHDIAPAENSSAAKKAPFGMHLVSDMKAGSNRLSVENAAGVKKGMLILVGSGSKSELAKVAGLGTPVFCG